MGDSLYNVNFGAGSSATTPYHMSGPTNQMLSTPEQQYNGSMHQRPTNHHGMNYYGTASSGMSVGGNDLVANMGAMGLNPTELNLSANEFYPKTGPAGNLLHQSSSAPNFENFTKPMNPMLDNVHCSPALTPTGSPQTPHRRVKPPQLSPPMLNMAAHLTSQQQQDLVQENFGGTTYFYNKDEYVSPTARQVFRGYSMYAGVPPHIAHMQPNTTSQAFFMKDEIKADMLRRQAVVLSEVEGLADMPAEVDKYCSVVPLELSGKPQMSNFGYPCTVYKALNQKDGLTYCLHRVHGFKLTNTKVMQVIEKWKMVSSAHIVSLREVFTTKAFNDNSIVFVYDYHPAAETLAAKHFSNPLAANGYASPFSLDGAARPFSAGKGIRKPIGGQITEANIWSYVIQLTGALRVIHSSHLCARGLLPSKILVTDKNKLRINCLGVLDVLTSDGSVGFPGGTPIPLQQEDMHSLGKIFLALACNSPLALRPDNINSSLELIGHNYSTDLYKLIRCLLTPPPPSPQQQNVLLINSIMPMIGGRFYLELESVHNKVDSLEHEMIKECESGRLFRLQAKLNTILERPEFNMDAAWSETGDRYLLKLFRDYVFHQTNESGAPWIDMAHIVSTLNKLDAGISEKICLSSGDETNVIIVSYQELKRCLEAAYSELIQANVSSYSH